MNQLQFDMICKIITAGAPVLANELCSSLHDVIVHNNELITENAKLKTTIEELRELQNDENADNETP